MRLATALCLMIAGLTCREIQPFSAQPDAGFQGYQLNASVTTIGGVPVDSVLVRLSYNHVSVGLSPVDTQNDIVSNPNQILDVRVFSPAFEQVRKLFTGTHPVGIVPRYNWDGLGDDGNPVPSGKYLVRYSLDALIVKYSTVVISGTVAALTDAQGFFTIPSARLPIGLVYDEYSPDDVYLGTAQILPFAVIELGRPPSPTIVRRVVPLQKDRVTEASFILNLQ